MTVEQTVQPGTDAESAEVRECQNWDVFHVVDCGLIVSARIHQANCEQDGRLLERQRCWSGHLDSS